MYYTDAPLPPRPSFPTPGTADKWSPALQIRTVLLSIQALLSAPNPDDPLANDVADLWKKDEAKAIEIGEWSTAHCLVWARPDKCLLAWEVRVVLRQETRDVGCL